MTAAQFEQQEAPEMEAVLRWRFEELVRAGYDPGSAMIVAGNAEVDLHPRHRCSRAAARRHRDADRPVAAKDPSTERCICPSEG